MANVELIALCIAARRRGLTYGQLVAQTTEAERRRIVDKYRRGPKRKIKEDKQGRALEPALCGMTLCAASGPPGAAQRANALPYISN